MVYTKNVFIVYLLKLEAAKNATVIQAHVFGFVLFFPVSHPQTSASGGLCRALEWNEHGVLHSHPTEMP